MKDNLKINLIILVVLFTLTIMPNLASAVLLSDQGTEVKDKSTGELLSVGDLTISIYDSSIDGNLIFSETFPDAIVNGSWNIIMSPTLEFGKIYWKDYSINDQDLDFDGNERLNFQSPLGVINNISFINFSLINSCPEGSSIRLIYENGSVMCESDDSGSEGIDLTNYALKNQSETFSGDITTTETGFFGFLGSLITRITKLFVQDIDVSGNIVVEGNVTATYFIGNGSLLTDLPAGTETDPIFVSQNATMWANIYNKFNLTYEGCVNNKSYLSTYNATYETNMANSSWNESYASELFAPISSSGDNSSWNETYATGLFAPNTTKGIQFLINGTGIYANQTRGAISILGVNISSINSTLNWIGVNDTNLKTAITTNSSRLLTINLTNNMLTLLYNSNLTLKNLTLTGSALCNSTDCFSLEDLNRTGTSTGGVDNSSWIVNDTSINSALLTNSSRLLTINDTTGSWITINDTALSSAILTNSSRLLRINVTGNIQNLLYNANQTFWNITLNGNKICNSTSCFSFEDLNRTGTSTGGNLTFNQTATDDLYIKKTNESKLDVNSSLFFGLYNVLNTTQFGSAPTITLLESWFDSKFESLYRNFFDQDLNTTATPMFVGINITGNDLYNGTSHFTFEDLNRTGTSTGGGDNSSWIVNDTSINSALLTNSSRLLTINSTSNWIATNDSNLNTSLSNLNTKVGNMGINTTSINSSTSSWITTNDTTLSSAILTNSSRLLTINSSTGSWITINDTVLSSAILTNSSRLLRINVTGNIQNLLYNANQTFWNITLNGNSICNSTDCFSLEDLNRTGASSGDGSYNSTYEGRINSLNSTKANVGNCSGGQVVQNSTINGVQCITPGAGNEVDPTWTSNLTNGISLDLNPLTNIIQSIGSSATRWLKGWFQDLDISGNVSASYYFGSLNKSTFPTSSCPGTEKVVSINTDGTVSCAADEGGSSASMSDSDFERESGTVFFEPFLLNSALETGEVGRMGWNYAATGTGAGATGVVPTQGNHPGQLSLSTGTTNASNVTLDLGITMNFDSYTGNITYEWMFNLSNSAGGANNYTLVMGFADNLGTVITPVDGIYFLHNATNSNWYAVTSSNSAKTINLTSVTVTSAAWTKMRIDLINQSTNLVNFYINDALVASQGTNIPQGIARAMGPLFTLRKWGGTTARTLVLDYVYYKQTFQVTR